MSQELGVASTASQRQHNGLALTALVYCEVIRTWGEPVATT